VVGILGRLSTGVSRVSIRHGHTTPRRKQPRHNLTGFKKGLGERIWVHHHIVRGMIIYTHEPELPVPCASPLLGHTRPPIKHWPLSKTELANTLSSFPTYSAIPTRASPRSPSQSRSRSQQS
jgi:hypothetical protein